MDKKAEMQRLGRKELMPVQVAEEAQQVEKHEQEKPAKQSWFKRHLAPASIVIYSALGIVGFLGWGVVNEDSPKSNLFTRMAVASFKGLEKIVRKTEGLLEVERRLPKPVQALTTPTSYAKGDFDGFKGSKELIKFYNGNAYIYDENGGVSIVENVQIIPRKEKKCMGTTELRFDKGYAILGNGGVCIWGGEDKYKLSLDNLTSKLVKETLGNQRFNEEEFKEFVRQCRTKAETELISTSDFALIGCHIGSIRDYGKWIIAGDYFIPKSILTNEREIFLDYDERVKKLYGGGDINNPEDLPEFSTSGISFTQKELEELYKRKKKIGALKLNSEDNGKPYISPLELVYKWEKN